jgi:hypothetical protein
MSSFARSLSCAFRQEFGEKEETTFASEWSVTVEKWKIEK